jgi:hypothetical protein
MSWKTAGDATLRAVSLPNRTNTEYSGSVLLMDRA